MVIVIVICLFFHLLHWQSERRQQRRHAELQAQFARGHSAQEQNRIQQKEDSAQAYRDRQLILGRQEETLRRVQQTQDLVVSTSSTLLQQNFELLENTLPRLFIILPDRSSPWDSVNVLHNTFRLYFLCECGVHTQEHHQQHSHNNNNNNNNNNSSSRTTSNTTTTNNNDNSHKIHIANHEGYVIHQPTEFLRKYGRYLRLIFEMLKFGVQVSGVVIPPVGKITGGALESIGEAYDHLSTDIERQLEKLDQILKTSEANGESRFGDEAAGSRSNISRTTLQEQFEEALAIGGPALRAIIHHLQNDSKAFELGHLFRMVTREGKVKWVCDDHRPKTHFNFVAQEAILERTIKAVNGIYDNNLRKITVTLTSPAMAQTFYNAFQNARVGILELDVHWTWRLATDDMEKFQKMVSTSNLKALTIRLDQSARTAFARRFYTPMMKAILHSSLQHVVMTTLPLDFFIHADFDITKSTLSLLETLTVDWQYIPTDPAGRKRWKDFLDSLPCFRLLNLVDGSRDEANNVLQLKLGNPTALRIYKKCQDLEGQYSLTIGPWILIPPATGNNPRPNVDNLYNLVWMFGNTAQAWQHYNNNHHSSSYHWVQSEMDAVALTSAARKGKKFKSLAVRVSVRNPATLSGAQLDISRAIERSALTRFHCVVEQQGDLEMIQNLQWNHLQHLRINLSRLEEPGQFESGMMNELENHGSSLVGLETLAIEANKNSLTIDRFVRVLKALPSTARLRSLSFKVPISTTEFQSLVLPWIDFSNLEELTVMIKTDSANEVEKVVNYVHVHEQRQAKFMRLVVFHTATTFAQAKRERWIWN